LLKRSALGGRTIKVYVAKCILGVFAFDDKGKLVDSIPFKGSPQSIADRYSSDKDEEAMAKKLKSLDHKVITSSALDGFEHEPDNPTQTKLFKDMVAISVEQGTFKSKVEALKVVRDVGLILASKELSTRRPGKDVQAAQAVRMLDDLNKVIERLGQRIREWFLALYPDRVKQMPGPETIEDHDDPRYHAIVAELYKKNLEVIHRVLSSEKPIGSDDGSSDYTLETVRAVATELMNLFKERDRLEKYISQTMEEAAPKLAQIAGPVLGARLIAQAGSLERLALKASTEVQLLGARKAVFRHLRHGQLPPKHGLVFVHPAVSGSQGHQRGKAAKVLGSYIARAARSDAFESDMDIDELKAKLDTKIEQVRTKPRPELDDERPRGRTKTEKKPGSRERRRQKARGQDRQRR
jgi:nucleolar protein 56